MLDRCLVRLATIFLRACLCGITDFRKHFLTMSEADGRLHEFNVYWSPLTDSESLGCVKLLNILLDLIDVDEGAEKPSETYTPEQRCSLEKCSDAVDTYHIHYDPRVAQPLAAQLAQCLPDLA